MEQIACCQVTETIMVATLDINGSKEHTFHQG